VSNFIPKSFASHLECGEDRNQYALDQLDDVTCRPGDVPQVRYDLEQLSSAVTKQNIAQGPSSLWRYAPMLPASHPEQAITLSEGWTPLIKTKTLGTILGCRELYVKEEGRNPSGSFKDRGASVGITQYKELGVDTVILNSSGNAGAAWALYAARAGLNCVNILSEDVLPASLQQCLLAGMPTFLFDGPWQESGQTVQDLVQSRGWSNVGTLQEPFRLEGKKTMGYEICEQLDWELPDVVVYPTGGGLGAIGIFKAFSELRELGWVDGSRMPRLLVTQYEGCAPIVKAFEQGKHSAETWADLDVLPGGLKSARPPGDKMILKLLRETGGTAISVSTEEALDSVAMLARLEGLLPCPESATTFVGLRKAIACGDIHQNERVVVIDTGSALKSIPNLLPASAITIQSHHGVPSNLID